ncbi:hypothetical protein WJ970_04970 [Achromobacter xylosoxidans]
MVTLVLGFYYQKVRRDLVILAMLAAGVICVSLRVVGEWLLRLEPGAWAALPLAALLMAEAVWAARWLRGLAAEGKRPRRRPMPSPPAPLPAIPWTRPRSASRWPRSLRPRRPPPMRPGTCNACWA